MAVSANHNLGGCVILLRLYLIDIVRKIIGGFQGYRPFQMTHPPKLGIGDICHLVKLLWFHPHERHQEVVVLNWVSVGVTLGWDSEVSVESSLVSIGDNTRTRLMTSV